MKKKQKGFSISFEVMLSALLMTMMMNICVYTINVQTYQKTMYNALITTCIEVSRWGGTSNNAYKVNNRSVDITTCITNELARQGIDRSRFSLTASPNKITSSNENITIRMKWKDPTFMGLEGSTKTIEVKTNSLIRSGSLL